MKTIIRFPFDILAIIYINAMVIRNTSEYELQFLTKEEYVEKILDIFNNRWVGNFNYYLASLFYILVILWMI